MSNSPTRTPPIVAESFMPNDYDTREVAIRHGAGFDTGGLPIASHSTEETDVANAAP